MTTTRIVYDMPSKDYHMAKGVSASYLKRFAQCPAAVLVSMESSPAMMLGSALHALVLEDIAPTVAPDCDKRSNAGKAAHEAFAAANAGKDIITADQSLLCYGMQSAIQAHPFAAQMVKGQTEVSVFWTDAETGLDCKARFDCISSGCVVDLKSCTDASQKGFLRAVCNFNYDLQAAWYLSGAMANEMGLESFCFVAVQNKEPYEVLTCYLSDEWIEAAMSENRRLLRLVAECKAKGYYPAYEIPAYCQSLDELNNEDLMVELTKPAWR